MNGGAESGLGGSGPTRPGSSRKDVFFPDRNFEITVACHGALPRDLTKYLDETGRAHGFERQFAADDAEQSAPTLLADPWNSQRSQTVPGQYQGATGTTTFGVTRWHVPIKGRDYASLTISYVYWHFRETADDSTSIVAKLEDQYPGGVAAKISAFLQDLQRRIEAVKPTEVQKLLRLRKPGQAC